MSKDEPLSNKFKYYFEVMPSATTPMHTMAKNSSQKKVEKSLSLALTFSPNW